MLRCADLAIPGRMDIREADEECGYTMCATIPTEQHSLWKSWQPEVLFPRFSFAPC